MKKLLLPLAAAAALIVHIACSQGDDAFKFASPERTIVLPADHASHPDYQNEWWYYTGQLRSKDGRRFGFQLTWFRVGLTRDQQEGS